MATLTQGSSTTIAVSSGHYVLMKNSAGDNARLELAKGISAVVHHNGTAVYGPFDAQTLKIAAIKGNLTYQSGVVGPGSAVSPMGRL